MVMEEKKEELLLCLFFNWGWGWNNSLVRRKIKGKREFEDIGKKDFCFI